MEQFALHNSSVSIITFQQISIFSGNDEHHV